MHTLNELAVPFATKLLNETIGEAVADPAHVNVPPKQETDALPEQLIAEPVVVLLICD